MASVGVGDTDEFVSLELEAQAQLTGRGGQKVERGSRPSSSGGLL